MHALDQIFPALYDDLRGIAGSHLRREPPSAAHSLCATELAHEAYLNLAASRVRIADGNHLCALASISMRRILIGRIRTHRAQKRGGGSAGLQTFDAENSPAASRQGIVELRLALGRLRRIDPRKARILWLVFFCGFGYGQAAQAAGVSLATVRRDLRIAKLWLRQELEGT